MEDYRPWREAWADALYGPQGFYRRPEGPAGHFRTASHASSSGLLGSALARLAEVTGCAAVLDVGAGRGELLRAVHVADPSLTCTGVDVVGRPGGLPDGVRWAQEVPAPDRPTLLVAWELLDVVPVPVLEVDGHGAPRMVQVRGDGAERLSGRPAEADLDWCERWWPLRAGGARAEVGRKRDVSWGRLVDRLGEVGGVALAVDYGHDRQCRPVQGTLRGYRSGRLVPPAPDGSCDITADVALDAVAAARPGAVRMTQRDALRALGVTPHRPEPDLASRDPRAYLAGLAAAGEAGELLDPGGLGAFGWVLHPVGEDRATRLAAALTVPGRGAAPSSAPDLRGHEPGAPAPPGR